MWRSGCVGNPYDDGTYCNIQSGSEACCFYGAIDLDRTLIVPIVNVTAFGAQD